MAEYILLAGLFFVLGMLVGRAYTKAEAAVMFMRQMTVTSTVLSIIRNTLDKHGLQSEVDQELRKAGLAVEKQERK